MAKKKKQISGSKVETETQSSVTDNTSCHRIKDVKQARELWVKMDEDHDKRDKIWAQVRNQINGGRPFDPEVLRKNGEEWRANFNSRDSEAAFNRAYLPLWKMVHEVPRKAAIKIHSQAPDAPKWEVGMAEAFDLWVNDCGPDYFFNMQGTMRDYVMYGPGFCMWPDTNTPRFKWANTVQLRFPKRTKTNPEEWEIVALRREMTASQLWEHCSPKERKQAEDMGWCQSAMEGTMRDMYAKKQGKKGWNAQAAANAAMQASGTQTQEANANEWQDAISSNDLAADGVWPPVKVIDLWAKDANGKIRHYIFTEDAIVDEYLYQNEEEADTFCYIFGSLFYDIGDNGLIHSIKGFGVKNYHMASTQNRMKCRLIDAAVFSMGMNFERTDDSPDETPPIENYSMVNVIPKGLKQLQYYPQLAPAGDILAMLKQNQDENNYTYNEVQQSIGDTNTAKQAEILANIGQEMTTSISTTFLAQIGRNIYTECIRRLRKKGSGDKDAKKFVERCLERGIPKDVIHDVELTVTTGASPTMSSPLVRGQIATMLRQRIYNLPGANRRAIDEFEVANLVGADGVNRFLLPEGSASMPEARRNAQQENIDFGAGGQLEALPSDAHVEHLDEHLKPLEAIIQAAQQGQKPSPDHLMALQTTLPHVNQHLQLLAPDETRRQEFKELKARASNVMSSAGGIFQRLQRLQDRSAVQSNQVGPDQVAAAIQGPAS